jgi:hypothetical protein
MLFGVAIGLQIALAGCTTTVTFMPSNPAPRPMVPRKGLEVEVFERMEEVRRPYVHVGFLDARPDDYSQDTSESVFNRLRAEAGKVGCEAMVITYRSDYAEMRSAARRARHLPRYSAACLVYR